MQREARMVKWRIVYTKQAQKDARMIAAAGLRQKAEKQLNLLSRDPFQTPPPYEKLRGDLSGAYARRINIHHRLVYQVISEVRTVKVIRMWTHYE
jgi:toxin YoeB